MLIINKSWHKSGTADVFQAEIMSSRLTKNMTSQGNGQLTFFSITRKLSTDAFSLHWHKNFFFRGCLIKSYIYNKCYIVDDYLSTHTLSVIKWSDIKVYGGLVLRNNTNIDLNA